MTFNPDDAVPPNGWSTTVRRVLLLDENGSPFSDTNPLPINIDEVNFTGDINIAAFQDITGVAVDAYVFTSGVDVSAITPHYQAIAGYDYTNDKIQAISLDSSGKPQNDLVNINGNTVNVNGGNRDTGTQTITLADDDPAVSDLNTISTTNTDIKTAVEIMDDWDATEDSAIGTDGAVEMLEAKSAQKIAVDDGDAVIPVTNLNGEQVIAGFTWATESNRTEEIDPIDEHYVEEELIDDTDIAAATNYYPSSTGKALGNFNNVSIHGVTSGGVTVTVEAKIDDSTDWIDITLSGYDLLTNTSDNASFVDKSFLLDFDDLHVRNVRIKSVTSDATNGVQYHWKLTAL